MVTLGPLGTEAIPSSCTAIGVFFMGASVLLSRTSKGCGYDMGVGDEGKDALLDREAPIRQSPCPSVDNDLCPLLSKGLNGYLKFLHHLVFQTAG